MVVTKDEKVGRGQLGSGQTFGPPADVVVILRRIAVPVPQRKVGGRLSIIVPIVIVVVIVKV